MRWIPHTLSEARKKSHELVQKNYEENQPSFIFSIYGDDNSNYN